MTTRPGRDWHLLDHAGARYITGPGLDRPWRVTVMGGGGTLWVHHPWQVMQDRTSVNGRPRHLARITPGTVRHCDPDGDRSRQCASGKHESCAFSSRWGSHFLTHPAGACPGHEWTRCPCDCHQQHRSEVPHPDAPGRLLRIDTSGEQHHCAHGSCMTCACDSGVHDRCPFGPLRIDHAPAECEGHEYRVCLCHCHGGPIVPYGQQPLTAAAVEPAQLALF